MAGTPNFIDYVKIFCRSGKGGAGAVHFHRDKFTTKGGPDGGDGGQGGHVIIKGNKQLWTLLHLKYRKHVHAPDGEPGSKTRKSGASGKDIILEVPLGTVSSDVVTGKKIFEIVEDGQEEIIVAGGKGGLGNVNFKTATRQAPKFAQPGIAAEEGWKILELKVLADVGLVGYPNAGKSTLLSKVSAAKPKIADYPFTTLTPNLGIVSYRDQRSFVMADIPGIIEGAHEGKGLGLRFLRHIERNSLLLFMVPIDSEDIAKEYKVLLKELKLHNPELMLKYKLLAVTKNDLAKGMDIDKNKLHLPDVQTVFISSITGEGLDKMKDMIWKTLND